MKTHRNVTPRQEAIAERNLFEAVASLRTAQECRAFFRDLCTPAELQAMADRWAVVDFLKRGMPYREIHRITGVSVTTIGRVARFLDSGNGGYALAASRLEADKAPPEGRRAEDGAGGRRVSAARRAEVSRNG
jgi:TrpR-related protein YerC/YecD